MRERAVCLTDAEWKFGTYPRRNYKYQNLYTCYAYKDFKSFWNLNTGRYTVTDRRILAMEQAGILKKGCKDAYDREILQFTDRIAAYDDGPMEALYHEVQKIRLACVGAEALEQFQMVQMRKNDAAKRFAQELLGIDQRQQKENLLNHCEAVILAVTQPELAEVMRRDLEQALHLKRQVYLLAGEDTVCDIPKREVWVSWLKTETYNVQFLYLNTEMGLVAEKTEIAKELQMQIDTGMACLMVYGEDGFLNCRHLNLDVVVHGIPSGFYTQAVTNQLAEPRPCIVYVPPHFDIAVQVPLLERTVVSYWQLAQLQKRFGDEVYTCSAVELYRRYPQYFLNVYEYGADCPEAEAGYPIQVCQSEEEVFSQARERAIQTYLDSLDGIEYHSAWFSETLERQAIPWGCDTQQKGILVQGVRVKKVKNAQVISCEGMGMRQLVHQLGKQDGKQNVRIFSNFLFFMTPRLEQMYNELRNDRPLEQHQFHREHLDFQWIRRENGQIQSFPLFRKACIAMKSDGTFLFFSFRLGGGWISAAGQRISWQKQDVDSSDQNRRVCVYTPYGTVSDENTDPSSYKKEVGKDRLNLVIVQQKIVCIRMGEVVLPSAGVVISLERQEGETFLKETGLRCLKQGYYDVEGLELEVCLERPETVEEQDWESISWAYGGGLSLIRNGNDLCADDGMEQHFREEGWMSPLSRQTQEAEIHRMVKHPRTAIGLTKDGSLVMLVYSGRIRLSAGADYREMSRIAKQIFPDIQSLMNVDGGGSAMLGMSIGDSFMELSYPAMSLDSCAGMVRPIQTALCLEL